METWFKWFLGLASVGCIAIWAFLTGEDASILIPAAFCLTFAGLIYWLYGTHAGYRLRYPAPRPTPPPKRPPATPLPEQRTSPSSPEEPHKATNYLRLARSCLDDAFQTKHADEQEQHFAAASRALNHVRNLDPSVRINVEHKGTTYTETHDDIAAQLLYFESKLHYDRGQYVRRASVDTPTDKLLKSGDIIGELDAFDREAYKFYAKAIEPARMAVQYRPASPLYQRNLSRIASVNGIYDEAKEALDAAYKLDPDDIETLKMMT